MPVIPDSEATIPLAGLRNGIAASTAFQAHVGAKSDIAALASIYYVSFPTPAPGVAAPLVVLDVDSASGSRIGVGVSPTFEWVGRIEAILRAPITDSSDAAQGDALVAFLNLAGAIIRDVLDSSTGPECYLNIVRVSYGKPARPTRNQRAELGDFYELVIAFEYEGGH